MSTKATIYIDNKVHIYVELLNGSVHISYENVDGTMIDIKIMPLDEWKKLGFPMYPMPIRKTAA